MKQICTAEECWAQFQQTFPSEPPEKYDAWAFGDTPEMADQLGKLVIKGTKTATTSCLKVYELEEEPLPRAGEFSVVLGGSGHALCVIETTQVDVVPFNEVSAEHAWREGEGDRSLDYWRDVHQAFFSRELAGSGLTFDPAMDVVCETFRLVHVPEQTAEEDI